MKLLRVVLALVLVSTLVACSSNQPATKSAETAKPAKREVQLLTGREAFQKMYVSARGWVGDAKPYSLESVVTSESNGQGGKSAIWRGGFASLSRRGLKAFLWSGSAQPDATPGVSSGVEDTYNPSNSSTQTFDMGFLKIDSDKAYDVALKHGGEKLIKAKADQPVMYTLDWSPRENILTWHVIFGSDLQDAKLRVAVNASTGEFIRNEK
jgi:hypothetical protein